MSRSADLVYQNEPPTPTTDLPPVPTGPTPTVPPIGEIPPIGEPQGPGDGGGPIPVPTGTSTVIDVPTGPGPAVQDREGTLPVTGFDALVVLVSAGAAIVAGFALRRGGR